MHQIQSSVVSCIQYQILTKYSRVSLSTRSLERTAYSVYEFCTGMFTYAKRGNLVDADVSGAKASTKHLESRLEVIQGHAFWDHWKACVASRGKNIKVNNDVVHYTRNWIIRKMPERINLHCGSERVGNNDWIFSVSDRIFAPVEMK